MRPFRSSAVVVLSAAAFGLVWAEEDGEHRHQGAHKHGVASLRLAQDEGAVHIELESPAINIVGFEHAPSNTEDREALARAVEVLRDGSKLFRFPDDAECSLKEVEVETPLLAQGNGHSDAHGPDASQDPGHDEDHDGKRSRDQYQDHAHASDSAHRESSVGDRGQAHADIHASYLFACANPEALQALQVGWFAAFPDTRKVQVEYVVPTVVGVLAC